MKKQYSLPFLFGICLMLITSGCASIDVKRTPGVDLTTIKSIYVIRLAADERGVNQVIADQLALRGYDSTTGEAGDAPAGVDAVITYQDKWMWDITMYLLELNVQIREPQTRVMMASAKTYRPSLQRKSVEDMVDEVLDSVLKNPQ